MATLIQPVSPAISISLENEKNPWLAAAARFDEAAARLKLDDGMRKVLGAPAKEIIVLTDGQQHGWADLESLAALENLGNQWHADAKLAKSDGVTTPSLRVVKVGGAGPDDGRRTHFRF